MKLEPGATQAVAKLRILFECRKKQIKPSDVRARSSNPSIEYKRHFDGWLTIRVVGHAHARRAARPGVPQRDAAHGRYLPSSRSITRSLVDRALSLSLSHSLITDDSNNCVLFVACCLVIGDWWRKDPNYKNGNFHIVPVSGLIVGALSRYEVEHRTALEQWVPNACIATVRPHMDQREEEIESSIDGVSLSLLVGLFLSCV